MRGDEPCTPRGGYSSFLASDAVRSVVAGAADARRRAMAVPADHAVLFQPSATAAMDVVVRNLVAARSFHFVRGAFAERFAATAAAAGREPLRETGPWDQAPDWRAAEIPPDAELVAVTHNETSTGGAWPLDEIAALRAAHRRPLVAVDVTSSFGALATDWRMADVWFGSVQKCLGLPAGLGYLVAGPRALERARALGSARRVAPWQDLPAMAERMTTGQTFETPNVLAIALLGRRMARWDLAAVEAATRRKAERIAAAALPWRPYVAAPAWRSATVHCMAVDDPAAWRARAAAAGFVLGGGYGPLAATCVRIATFPAHGEHDVDALLACLAG